MSTFNFIFLNLGCIVIFLVISSFFKQHTRTIFWTAGLLLFVATCFLLGFGVIRMFINGRPNGLEFFIPIFFLGESAVFIIKAEQWNTAMKSKDKALIVASSDETVPFRVVDDNGLVLPGKLDIPLAREIFEKAISKGIIEVSKDGDHLIWKLETVSLLAYLCGRIYCEDESVKDKANDYIWKNGKRRRFPDKEICKLFNITDVGQARNNNRFSKVPQDFQIIDNLFKQ